MLYSMTLAFSAFLATAILHLTALRWFSGGMAAIPLNPIARLLAVLVLLFFVHTLEIGLFSGIYAVAEHWLTLGSFSGQPIAEPLGYFYFSAITYTSLGIGDIFPTGHLRFLTAVEALIGLLLIAWSAAFLFAMMNRLWEWQTCAVPDKRKATNR